MSDEQPFPFKPKDWVANSSDRVAQVKGVWRDTNGEVLLDLILYDYDGTKIGRESEAMGGPRSFEPACSSDGWERIAEPNFPIRPHWIPTEDGRVQSRMWAGERLPPAQYVPRKRKARALNLRLPDDRLRRALEQIADGHNDPRSLAAEVLGRKR